MPEDTQDRIELNRLEEQKKSAVEDAIKDSELYKNLQETLSEYPGISLNISAMVEEYMDFSGKAELISNPANVLNVNSDIINYVIRGTIYSISQEENNLVLDDNGVRNDDETIRAMFRAKYSMEYIEGLDKLTQSEKQALITEVSNVLDVKKMDDIFVMPAIFEKNYKPLEEFSWNNIPLTQEDRRYIAALETATSEKEIKEISFDYAAKKIPSIVDDVLAKVNHDDIQSNTDSIQESVEAEKLTPEEIQKNNIENLLKKKDQIKADMNVLALFLNYGEDSFSKDQMRQYTQRIIHTEAGKSVLDPSSGQVLIEKVVQRSKVIQNEYLTMARVGILQDYLQSERRDFESLKFDEKDNIFGSALMLYTDENAAPEIRSLAFATLQAISPNLLKEKEGKKGEYELDGNAVAGVYNGMRDNTDLRGKNAVIAAYYKSSQEFLIGYLDDRIEAKDYNPIDLSKLETIAKKAQEFTEKGRNKLALRGIQARLGAKLDDALDRIGDGTLSHQRKVNTVIGTYLTLKDRVDNPLSDIGNYESNKRALELLEAHIKSNSIDYGNYIDISYNEEGEEVKREISIKKNALMEYRKENGEHIGDVNVILDTVREMALRDLWEHSSFTNMFLTKDGIEIFANYFKDGVKHFIKSGLNRVTKDETKTREILDNVKANKAYQIARNSTYAVLGTTYKGLKGLSKIVTAPIRPLANRLFPSNSRLALPNSSEKITIGDIGNIIRSQENKNFIRSEEQLHSTGFVLKYSKEFETMTREQKAELDKRIKDKPWAKRFINEQNGHVDIDRLFRSGNRWKHDYLNQKRAESLSKFVNKDDDIETPEVLRAAIMAFKDDEAPIQMKRLSAAIIEMIAPEAVSREKGEIGLTINEKEFLKAYNKNNADGKQFKNFEDMIAGLDETENLMAVDKVHRLQREGLGTEEERNAAKEAKRNAAKEAKKIAAKESKKKNAKIVLGDSSKIRKVERKRKKAENTKVIEHDEKRGLIKILTGTIKDRINFLTNSSTGLDMSENQNIEVQNARQANNMIMEGLNAKKSLEENSQVKSGLESLGDEAREAADKVAAETMKRASESKTNSDSSKQPVVQTAQKSSGESR